MGYTRRKTEYRKVLRRIPMMLELTDEVEDAIGKSAVKTDIADDVIQTTANRVLTPALHGFVLYVLEDAMKRGIKRLYFLARDAYFMYQLAATYVEFYELPLECRYLYVSRFSLRVPLYHKDMERALDYITLGGLDVTPEKILNRSGITEKQKTELLGDIGHSLGYQADEQIPRDHLPEIRDYLKNHRSFIKYVTQVSKEAYPLLTGYLTQEHFGECLPTAVVDSGWVGSMQQNLSDLRYLLGGDSPLEGYYFGLYELPQGVDRNTYHSYYFSPEGEMKRKVGFSNCLFEGVFSAPHGMTLGYQLESGEIRPVVSETTEERIQCLKKLESVYDVFQQKVLEGNDTWQKLLQWKNIDKLSQMIERLFAMLMSCPSPEEAEVYGRMNFTDDVLEYEGHAMAAEMSERDMRDNHLFQRMKQEMRQKVMGVKPVIVQSAWYEGSVVLYGNRRTIKRHLKSYRAYKYVMQERKRRRWLKNR